MDMDPIITADDVIRGGACRDGVMRVITRFPTKIAAAMPVSQVLKIVPADEHHHVLAAAELDGYGNGDGNGNGDGYGNGNGNGYGYGNGYGNGNGGYEDEDD